MSKLSYFASFCIAGVMGISLPMTALAANPQFARTEEEWARLQDNILEYGEIGDLIEEYNTTVLSNQYEYNHFVNEYGRSREDIAKSYRDLADDLESSMTGSDGMGMISDFQLEQQARQMREQADNVLEDSKVYYLTYSKVQDSLVMSAQSYFISYYRSQLETRSARNQLALLKDQVTIISSRQQAGTATQADVLSAGEAVMEQEKVLSSTIAQTEHARQSLIVLCGWKADDHPEIQAVPDVNTEVIDTIFFEKDTPTAEKNNYTLRINRQKLENALEDDNRASLERTIEGNKRQIGVSVTSALRDLQAAKRTWEQAVSEQDAAKRDLVLAEQKRSAGMITSYDYEAKNIAAAEAEKKVETAKLSLFEALETYRWNVNGLANAE